MLETVPLCLRKGGKTFMSYRKTLLNQNEGEKSINKLVLSNFTHRAL